jgi:hypothetical protein
MDGRLYIFIFEIHIPIHYLIQKTIKKLARMLASDASSNLIVKNYKCLKINISRHFNILIFVSVSKYILNIFIFFYKSFMTTMATGAGGLAL